MKIRQAKWLVALVLVAVFAASCGPAGPTVDTSTLTIGIASEPVSLDIHKTSWADIVHGLMYDTLVVLDADNLTYKPWLAEEYSVSEDGTEITFKLREDVTFHDGTPFNAAAVKYTYDRFNDPEMAAPGASAIGPLDEVVVVDEYTVKLVYSEPYAIAFFVLGGSYFGFVSEQAVNELGEDFGREPVSTGPYMIDELNPGDSVVYKRNPDYKWPNHLVENEGAALFERVVFKIIPDETTRVLALEEGTIDLMGVPSAHAARVEENEDLTVYKEMSNTVTYLGFNHKKAPWNDQRIRQAVAHAINKDDIVEFAMEGMAEPAYNLMPPIMWGYWEGASEHIYSHEPDKVKPLLAEAGYDVVDDEGFVTKDGERLTLEITTYSDPEYVRVTENVLTQLRDAGIDAKMRSLERSTLLASTPEGEHDAILILYGYLDPDIFYYFFHSSRLPTTNRCHFVDPEIDALLEEGRTTMDPDARFEVYKEVQTRLAQDGVWVPLFSSYSVTAVRNEVKDFKLHPATKAWLLHDAYKEAPGN